MASLALLRGISIILTISAYACVCVCICDFFVTLSHSLTHPPPPWHTVHGVPRGRISHHSSWCHFPSSMWKLCRGALTSAFNLAESAIHAFSLRASSLAASATQFRCMHLPLNLPLQSVSNNNALLADAHSIRVRSVKCSSEILGRILKNKEDKIR